MSNLYSVRNFLAPSAPVKDSTPRTVQGVLADANSNVGFLGRGKIRRAVSESYVGLTREAVAVLFANKSEELKHRAALELDRAKKRAIAESLTETAIIERSIVDMTNQLFHALDEIVQSNHNLIYERESIRMAQMAAAVATGRMSADRLEDAQARLQQRVTVHLARVESMIERLIANLGERWRRTLDGLPENVGGKELL